MGRFLSLLRHPKQGQPWKARTDHVWIACPQSRASTLASRITVNTAPPSPSPASPGLPPPEDQQLALLSVLFYVYSAFVAMGAVMCAGGALFGASFIPQIARGKGEPDLALIGGAFVLIFGFAAVLLAAKTVVMILTGRAFGRRQGYITCMIGACLAMTNIPLGTALGIFAIITLQKAPVKARLGAA